MILHRSDAGFGFSVIGPSVGEPRVGIYVSNIHLHGSRSTYTLFTDCMSALFLYK